MVQIRCRNKSQVAAACVDQREEYRLVGTVQRDNNQEAYIFSCRDLKRKQAVRGFGKMDSVKQVCVCIIGGFEIAFFSINSCIPGGHINSFSIVAGEFSFCGADSVI